MTAKKFNEDENKTKHNNTTKKQKQTRNYIDRRIRLTWKQKNPILSTSKMDAERNMPPFWFLFYKKAMI